MQGEIKTICMISMFAGIISAVIPSGKMKGAFNSFCAVVLIFYIILPLAGIKADSFKLFSAADSEKRDEALLSDVRTAEVMLYEQMLEKAVKEKLGKSGLAASVEAECEKINEKFRVNSFEISGCNDEESRKTAEKILTESFADVKVIFEVDNSG